MEKSAIRKMADELNDWSEYFVRGEKGWGDFSEIIARRLAAEEKAKPTSPASLPPNLVMGLTHLLCDVAQVFDGWHQDGTAWTEYDESVRKSVWHFQEELSRYQPAESLAELANRKGVKWGFVKGNGAEIMIFVTENKAREYLNTLADKENK